jgi:hypothetical protein
MWKEWSVWQKGFVIVGMVLITILMAAVIWYLADADSFEDAFAMASHSDAMIRLESSQLQISDNTNLLSRTECTPVVLDPSWLTRNDCQIHLRSSQGSILQCHVPYGDVSSFSWDPIQSPYTWVGSCREEEQWKLLFQDQQATDIHVW